MDSAGAEMATMRNMANATDMGTDPATTPTGSVKWALTSTSLRGDASPALMAASAASAATNVNNADLNTSSTSDHLCALSAVEMGSGTPRSVMMATTGMGMVVHLIVRLSWAMSAKEVHPTQLTGAPGTNHPGSPTKL